ncbi:MAG: tetratricopeptide repeat protein [Sphingobacteriales bacterium]|nr:tetratricopeptide repeat protein [Sphingobacteriales bacterium]
MKKKPSSCPPSLWLYFIIIPLVFFSAPLPGFSQVDTARMRREQQQKAREAQEQARQQLKKLGVDIDPNKKMTKEEAQQLKNKLLGKAEEMKSKLPKQGSGNSTVVHADIDISKVPSLKQVQQVADRFFSRSYKKLDAISRSAFDQLYKEAEKKGFTLQSVRKLSSRGAELMTFGNDQYHGGVYLAAAVKSLPSDTLCVNNFGAYLRMIDSTRASLPVLLYANTLFNASPVILTQIGCSLLELNDDRKAADYLKEALEINPDFGMARTALCEVYIRQKRFREALAELFAGVKNMGATYQQATIASQQIQAQFAAAGNKDEMESKEEFWNETRDRLEPQNDQGPMPNTKGRVKMPYFPDCKKVEDWMLGGGYGNAVQANSSFNTLMQSFATDFRSAHEQQPVLPANAVLRDYSNERFALDCITEMFFGYSKIEYDKYRKSADEITQRAIDAREIYNKNFADYSKELAECLQACSGDLCAKECMRKFCLKECPNANKYNDLLGQAYNDYRNAFGHLVHNQKKLLSDLYAFSNPWLAKVKSPYWSRIYAYEIKRVALSIAGNCFGAYPLPFPFPAMNECGTDCSVFLTPFTEKPDDVNKDNPDGNNCPDNWKLSIELLVCDIGLDCESIEFGCAVVVAGSVKRNFKQKSTTLFAGFGGQAELGVAGLGMKAGVIFTAHDSGAKDFGTKVELDANYGEGIKSGVNFEATNTLMEGYRQENKMTTVIGF